MYRLRYALINATDRRVRVFTRVAIVAMDVRIRTDTGALSRRQRTQKRESCRDCVPPADTSARDAYRVDEMHLHTRESVRDARKHNQGRARQKH